MHKLFITIGVIVGLAIIAALGYTYFKPDIPQLKPVVEYIPYDY